MKVKNEDFNAQIGPAKGRIVPDIRGAAISALVYSHFHHVDSGFGRGLAGRADIIAIRPKKADNKRLDLSARSNTVIFYICVLLLPAIPMAAGIRILIRRFR